MFKLVVEDAKVFKNALDSVVNLIEEGQLEVGKDGLSLKAMDASQIAMVCFTMPKAAFVEYNVDNPAKLGLNFDNLSKILGRTRGKEKLEVSQDENKLLLVFHTGKRKRSFKIPLIDLPGGASREPNIAHDVVVEMAAGAFKESLRDAALVSSHATLEAKDSKFLVEVHGDAADLNVENDGEGEDVKRLTVKSPARATFPLQYLDDIMRAAPESTEVSINLKSNAPVKIAYSIDNAKVAYYLAPRIDTD